MTDLQTLDTATLAQRLVDARRRSEDANQALTDLERLVQEDVHVKDRLERLHDAQVNLQAAENAARRRLGLEEIAKEAQDADHAMIAAKEAVLEHWNLDKKTVPCQGGKVTRSTTEKAVVDDVAACVRGLVEQDALGLIKSLSLEASKAKAYLSVKQVPGLSLNAKHAISVTLEDA